MNKMFIKNPEDGYHFDSNGIAKIVKKYDAKYMGYWCTKSPSGGWNDSPVDVFYVENPDRSKGHTNYFGMFIQNENVFITNAESAFSEPIIGILTDDGEVIVSRYRHDYVSKGKYMIDGGRDYARSHGGQFITVNVKDGEYVLNWNTETALNDIGDYT